MGCAHREAYPPSTPAGSEKPRAQRSEPQKPPPGKPNVNVSSQHHRAILHWFEQKESGNVVLPAVLYVDGRVASKKHFLEFLAHDDGVPENKYFVLEPHTPIDYEEEASSTTGLMREAFPGRVIHNVSVQTGVPAPAPGCLGDDCRGEGYETIYFVFDDAGQIIALHVTAAG